MAWELLNPLKNCPFLADFVAYLTLKMDALR